MKVLIIEDDIQIIEAIKLAFKIRWGDAGVIAVTQGENGVRTAKIDKPDIVILDLGLPDISGFEVLKRIRQFSNIPILILTVMSEESDKVRGLEWGADDYVTKPFKQLELLARVRALLRRQVSTGEGQVTCGLLRYKPDTFQFFNGNNEINLTRTEGIIIKHLMKNYGQVVTHASLADAIWGTNYPDAAQSLKVYIRRVREKMEEDPSQPHLIITKPGIGYYLASTDKL